MLLETFSSLFLLVRCGLRTHSSHYPGKRLLELRGRDSRILGSPDLFTGAEGNARCEAVHLWPGIGNPFHPPQQSRPRSLFQNSNRGEIECIWGFFFVLKKKTILKKKKPRVCCILRVCTSPHTHQRGKEKKTLITPSLPSAMPGAGFWEPRRRRCVPKVMTRGIFKPPSFLLCTKVGA